MTQLSETFDGGEDGGVTTDAEGSASSSGSLWRHADFLLLWGGQTVSDLGSAVTTLALPLLAVAVLKATTFQVSLIIFLTYLAYLLITLPAGVLVDQVRKHGLMMWCDLARTALVGSIPVVAVLWHVTLGQIYLVALFGGALSVFFDVAYQSYVPALVQGDQLVDANGKLGTTNSFAGLLGPSIGGALVGLIGAAKAVAVDAVSFAISALSLVMIRTPEPRPERRAEHVTFRAAMHEGLNFVVKHPILRRIVACTSMCNLFGSTVQAVEIVYLVRVLHASAALVGLLFSLGAVGGLIGGLTAGWFSRRVGSARIIWASILLPAPLVVMIPLATPGWGTLLFAAGNIVFSFSALLYNSAQVSYRQRICPPELLGRMNASVRWIVWGTLPLGSLMGGALGTWIGIRPTIWIGVVGSALGGLFVLFSPLRAMRDVPDQ
ncbi:MAG TPA: MFS transporter [Actinospica sp.]|nr:MFS transporter [Actinospica sp.]